MNEFFTWDFIATYAGMVVFVTLVTQTVKRYVNADPKWVSLAAAIFGQVAVQIFYVKDFSPQGMIMALINVFVVLTGAVGSFETLVKPFQKKTVQE